MLDQPRRGAPTGPPTVTREDITAGLRSLGLPRGAVVLVHSSLRRFGRVQGGADTVVEALLEAVGPDGTVVVPTLTFGSFNEQQPVFDARRVPSETGAITEALRRRRGACRSLHPTSSAAALGARAEEVCREHHITPCPLRSPYGQVYALGGWVLFLGTSFGCNSLFHVAEEIVRPDYLTFYDFPRVKLIDLAGRVSYGHFQRYNCAQTGVNRYLVNMEPVYEERGLIRERTIGASWCRLISAQADVEVACEVLHERPEYILSPLG